MAFLDGGSDALSYACSVSTTVEFFFWGYPNVKKTANNFRAQILGYPNFWVTGEPKNLFTNNKKMGRFFG